MSDVAAGAAQADAALLLVDGSPGGFEAGFDGASNGHAGSGGQTREHAQLARSLGVEQLAVVVSKLDTCGYSQVRSGPRVRVRGVGQECALVGVAGRQARALGSWRWGCPSWNCLQLLADNADACLPGLML